MSSLLKFWGVEVKAGKPLKVLPPCDSVIHISQAALGTDKKYKGKEAVPLFVNYGDQKLVIGTLSSENLPNISFDLVFDKEFELSHNWKSGSVYFCGYKVPLSDCNGDHPDSNDSEEEEIPLNKPTNGDKASSKPVAKAESSAKQVKAASKHANAAAKPVAKPESFGKKVKVIEPIKHEEDVDDDSEEDSDYDSSEDSEDDSVGEEESEDDDSTTDSEDGDDDEQTPAKAEQGKKRTDDSALETPSAKKAKTAASQEKGANKSVHIATPHPAKKTGKTPAGQFSCNSCEKTFGKEVGLQSHVKAKHA